MVLVHRTWFPPAIVVAALIALAPVAAARGQDTPTGIFVGTPDGPQEVAVYANRTAGGRVRLGVGTLDEVQRVPGLIRLICNLPHWRVRSAYLSTGRILDDERAPRRNLRLRTRRLTITAMVVQVMATESSGELTKVLDAVGATADNPAYLFLTLESGGMVRDYIVGVDSEEHE